LLARCLRVVCALQRVVCALQQAEADELHDERKGAPRVRPTRMVRPRATTDNARRSQSRHNGEALPARRFL
jgi:hypothetical protein